MLFNIEGYYTFRLNQNEYGGGILLYVREDITIIQIDSNQELYHWIFFDIIKFEKKLMALFLYL